MSYVTTSYRAHVPHHGGVQQKQLGGAVGAVEGLGKTFTLTLSTPYGSEKFAANVPYETLGTEAVEFMKGKAMAALPPLLNLAKAEAVKMLPTVLDSALKQGGGYITSTLWPQMAPKIRKEADRAIANATRNGAIIASGIIVAIFASAIWVRSKR